MPCTQLHPSTPHPPHQSESVTPTPASKGTVHFPLGRHAPPRPGCPPHVPSRPLQGQPCLPGFGQTRHALSAPLTWPSPKLPGSASVPQPCPHTPGTPPCALTLLATFRTPSSLGLQLPCLSSGSSPYLPQGVPLSLSLPFLCPLSFPSTAEIFPQSLPFGLHTLSPSPTRPQPPPLSRPTFLKPSCYQGPAPLSSRPSGLSPQATPLSLQAKLIRASLL